MWTMGMGMILVHAAKLQTPDGATDNEPVANADGVARINAAALGWTARVPPAPLASVTSRQFQSMCGSPLPKIFCRWRAASVDYDLVGRSGGRARSAPIEL